MADVRREHACRQGDEPLKFLIGRDSSGEWIVAESHGLYGGIFASRSAATRFAKFESGGRESTISISDQPLAFPLT